MLVFIARKIANERADMERRIKVHTCRAKPRIIKAFAYKNIETGARCRYYSDDPELVFYRELPEKCECKRTVTETMALDWLSRGKAFVIQRANKKGILKEPRRYRSGAHQGDVFITQIVLPVDRSQTPRIDLITSADIERAYVDGQRESIRMINEIHKMIMANRRALIVPFKDDPDAMYDSKGRLFPGRLLFPFGPDMRTGGGHS